jgi:hypothetical protein
MRISGLPVQRSIVRSKLFGSVLQGKGGDDQLSPH